MSAARLARLREAMAAADLPALAITNIDNLRYLSGFTGSAGLGLITHQQAWFLADPRYITQATRECSHFQVVPCNNGFVEALAPMVKDSGLRVLGFEKRHITFAGYEELRDAMTEVRLRPVVDLVEDLRLVKDDAEIQAIRAACQIADATFSYALTVIRPGMSERELALEIDWHMRKLGATKEGFDSIVAAGPNSAMPHAHPSDRPLAAGDFLVMDFGALVNGYNSDITRTVCVGKADERHREVYEVVRQAQEIGVEALRPGVRGADVDKASRDYIESRGYGDRFGHGLGHGLGRQVHDAGALNKKSTLELKPGMVFTVEPGIYIEGWGGVRIEDDVLVTESGSERLTTSPRELIEV